MKKMRLILLAAGMMVSVASLLFTGCTKEGPAGANGANGTNGADGKDANETCKQCHSPAMVDKVLTEFELAKHSWGVVAFEEAGNTGCTPCHASKAFIYVCQNNIPATFTLNSTTGKWVNDYATNAANAIGEINCWTCHTSLHTTYGASDLALTTTAPVPMTMWGGTKTIDLVQDSSMSNLCVKCHQPRPLVCNAPTTAKTNSRRLDYDSLKNFPDIVMFDSAAPNNNKWIKPSYRMHVHYGAIGAVYAGMGAVEFPGDVVYSNSKHTTVASCQNCHMADPMTGIAGGHAFNVRNAKESKLTATSGWNFNGCNVVDCHADEPINADAAKWKNTRTEIQGLLDDLATAINAAGGGHDILHSDNSVTNLWWGVSAGNYDGYLDIYTPGTNDAGYWRDPYSTNATNLTKPQFPTLTFLQVGACINFQFCLREYSLGIHNTNYVRALLKNTTKALTKASFANKGAINNARH